jgi:hypothetical protein
MYPNELSTRRRRTARLDEVRPPPRDALPFIIPPAPARRGSVPGFPASLHWADPRVLNRMSFLQRSLETTDRSHLASESAVSLIAYANVSPTISSLFLQRAFAFSGSSA